MDILRTFEIFLSAPMSLIRKRDIKIMHIETNIFAQKLPMDVKIDYDEVQLTVYNNNSVYKLLSNVLQKKKKLNNANKENTIYYERAGS